MENGKETTSKQIGVEDINELDTSEIIEALGPTKLNWFQELNEIFSEDVFNECQQNEKTDKSEVNTDSNCEVVLPISPKIERSKKKKNRKRKKIESLFEETENKAVKIIPEETLSQMLDWRTNNASMKNGFVYPSHIPVVTNNLAKPIISETVDYKRDFTPTKTETTGKTENKSLTYSNSKKNSATKRINKTIFSPRNSLHSPKVPEIYNPWKVTPNKLFGTINSNKSFTAPNNNIIQNINTTPKVLRIGNSRSSVQNSGTKCSTPDVNLKSKTSIRNSAKKESNSSNNEINANHLIKENHLNISIKMEQGNFIMPKTPIRQMIANENKSSTPINSDKCFDIKNSNSSILKTEETIDIEGIFSTQFCAEFEKSFDEECASNVNLETSVKEIGGNKSINSSVNNNKLSEESYGSIRSEILSLKRNHLKKRKEQVEKNLKEQNKNDSDKESDGSTGHIAEKTNSTVNMSTSQSNVCCGKLFVKSKTNKELSVKNQFTDNEKANGVKETQVSKDISFIGFKTASSKEIIISDSAANKAKSLFADISENEDEISKIEKHKPTSTKTKTFQANVGDANTTVNAFVGFKTANFKNIKISDKAMQKANGIFSEINNDINNSKNNTEANQKNAKKGNFVGFKTATCKDIAISNTAMEKAKGLFSEINNEEKKDIDGITKENFLPKCDNNQFVGFKTASFKNILVSKEATKKAESVFANISESSCSSLIASSTSNSSKRNNNSSQKSNTVDKNVKTITKVMSCETLKSNNTNSNSLRKCKSSNVLTPKRNNNAILMNKTPSVNTVNPSCFSDTYLPKSLKCKRRNSLYKPPRLKTETNRP